MTGWKDAREYVRLALEIDQHLPGFVDAYFGPQEIAGQVRQAGRLPLAELKARAGLLLDSIPEDPDLPPSRAEALAGEVLAMHTILQGLAGEPLTLSEEVEGVYGVEAEWIDESALEEIHHHLDDLLPGTGRLEPRLRAFETSVEVPAEVALQILREMMERLRASTRRLMDLPDGEACELVAVRDKPWAAYNRYLGQGRSSIEVCLDIPARFPVLPYLIAHETYPGHHTENAVKEARLLRQEGGLEWSLHLANAPSCVIAEGLATVACDVVTQPEERIEILREAAGHHGLSLPDPGVMDAVTRAGGRLKLATGNAAILLCDGGATDSEILAYLQRFGLADGRQAAASLAFLRDPVWRSYCFTYTAGEDLVRGVLGVSRSPAEAFANLLAEPAHPARLRRMLPPAARA
jgi:hypothetical protein